MAVNLQKIENNGWRQGASLYVDSSTMIDIVTKCQQEKLSKGFYFLVSQDCDILNFNLDKEPVVEVMQASVIDKPDYMLTSGQNPRCLHIVNGDVILEFFPNYRFFISRGVLENYLAHSIELSDSNKKILINWLIKRYKRSAFPDSFNNRIKPIVKNIKAILANELFKDTLLYVQLHSKKELHPDEAYNIVIKLLCNPDEYDHLKFLNQVQREFDKLICLFDQVKGIVPVPGSQVQSKDEISFYEIQSFQAWDNFDYISFMNENIGQVSLDCVAN